jgi:SagB-type dehydrogenase family enzyme
VSFAFRFDERKATAEQAYVLSRFSYCRLEGDGWLLASPRGHAVVDLHAPLTQRLLHELRRPCTAASLTAVADGLDAEGALLFLNLLANGMAVVPAEPGVAAPEADDPVLGQWEFHDLLFHARCRGGRHDAPSGGTFPFQGKFTPLPVVKPETAAEKIALFVPDLARLKQEDVPFTQVLESRTSLREPGETPLRVEQLGEFLYRSARIKKKVDEAGVSWRPAPAGGAIHELEIYPLVHRCEGLAAGLYHYDPAGHTLAKVAELTQPVQLLLHEARYTAQLEQPPQVVLILAARFQRIQFNYRSVSYAVILKNVGALFQTMYLVATAMGLAPCGLGGGDSDLFAVAAGLDYYAETSVGEFILSSRSTTPPPAGSEFARPTGH